MTPIRPPLKWAGGKYGILGHIRAHLPPGRTLFEPFMGSAVVSLNMVYDRYCLSDANPDLVDFYRCVMEPGPDFIEQCRSYFTPKNNTRARYNVLRNTFNRSKDPRKRAALLLYLNRHGYNGLYRVNKSGAFNVPHGRYKKPKFPEEALRTFQARADCTDVQQLPFEQAMQRAKPGDVVYCDPPYVPLSSTANFTGYTGAGFTLKDQETLVELAHELRARGVSVVISNHDTPDTQRLYRDAELHTFQVQRNISRNGKNRGKAPEVLAVFRATQSADAQQCDESSGTSLD